MMMVDDAEDLKIISQHFGYVVDYSYIAVISDSGLKMPYPTYCSFQIKKNCDTQAT